MNISFKEMCETIVRAGILEKKDGTKLTSEDVFQYSSTGELYMIFDWYIAAKEILEKRNEKEKIAVDC